jgi:hypothetical protein
VHEQLVRWATRLGLRRTAAERAADVAGEPAP